VRSCYDEGKRTAETLTMDYHRGASLEVRHHRSFNHIHHSANSIDFTGIESIRFPFLSSI
jgi:UDP-glucuronate decarboxylase